MVEALDAALASNASQHGRVRLQEGRAIYHWTLAGTNTGPSGTGRAVRISGLEVWQICASGLIANSRGHFDSVDYRRRLGF